MAALAPFYELVLWTECLNSADTVIDKLDPRRLFRHRLYRDATTYTGGEHRKDLAHLNRDLSRVLIIDCSPAAFSLQPASGISLKPYSSADDPEKVDKELTRLLPFLQFLAIMARKGSTTSFAEELQALKVATKIEDGGEAFEKAVEERFAELRAAGKLPLAGGRGRYATSRGGAAPEGGTLWERMGLRKSERG